MFVKSMILDGFKSYGKRIEINGFDEEFNAITGLNGSGKSNILDAICFVLGITALHNVRATSLQELVYKSGQAGIKKASVTITFDNQNKRSSPIGYESYDEITVTRQVVIDGKNKYLINGTNVPNKRVQDMFCSVQLNVNNPHFLIMQGRITKVLNMKPLEILSMIEEAAGTRMYEEKKEVAMKTIEKKNSRLNEINTILDEEVGPKLLKLKEERSQFVEFQRIERELEHCRKIVIAYRYITTLKDTETAQGDVQAVRDEISKKTEAIKDGKKEILAIDEQIKETTENLKNDKSNELEMLEQELKSAEKKESKLSAETKSNSENIKAEKKVIEQLETNLKEDKRVLAQKEAELEEVGGMFQKLRDQDQADSAAVVALQEKLQKISAGLLENEDGEDASLEQQLMNAKQQNSHAKTEIKQCETTLKHHKDLLKKKQSEVKTADVDYERDTRELKERQKEYGMLEAELNKINYEEGTVENLQEQRRNLLQQINGLRQKLDVFMARNHRLRFEYQDPYPNFNRESVKGLVCTLFKLKDQSAADALETTAGGKLYNVVVDTEKTSKAIVERGQLQHRATIIPLNKIVGRGIDANVVNFAQKLVGKENVQPALELIEFEEYLRPAMTWIFGQTLVCRDIKVAKTVAFHNNVQKRCVTLDGDTCDPSGTLSGGAKSKTGSILIIIDEFKKLQSELKAKEHDLQAITDEIARLTKTSEKFASLKQKLDLKKHDITMIRQRLELTTFHKDQEEIEALQAEIQQLEEKMVTAKRTAVDSEQRAKTLETQLKDSGNIRDKLRNDAENNLKIAQKKAEKSRKKWQKYEHQAETLNLELEELRKAIINTQEQLLKAQEKLSDLEEEKKGLEETLKIAKEQVAGLQSNQKAQKNLINQKNKQIQKLIARKDEIGKEGADFELDIKKLNHEIVAIENNVTECKKKVKDLLRKNDWISQDKAYFGEPGGIYDFSKNDPEAMAQKLHQLEGQRDKMSKTVNKRSINLLNKEEERFNDTVKKKNIVENDKRKILATVTRLEEKKKEILLQAWEQVNRDFGSIFSTLLPGANAKLQPTRSQNVLDGLEVKVGFSGVWKESLGELSGGQRSLVALSLILAMLLFKPAPLYILDEVDAALDLSHTQNIGTMLKRHFTHSQFIIVSLKDGMFNNANVLFTTKFVDGMSTINREEKRRKIANRP